MTSPEVVTSPAASDSPCSVSRMKSQQSYDPHLNPFETVDSDASDVSDKPCDDVTSATTSLNPFEEDEVDNEDEAVADGEHLQETPTPTPLSVIDTSDDMPSTSPVPTNNDVTPTPQPQQLPQEPAAQPLQQQPVTSLPPPKPSRTFQQTRSTEASTKT